MIRSSQLHLSLIGMLQSLCIFTVMTTATDSAAQDIKFAGMFGELGTLTGQFGRPTAVAVDNQGKIFVAERSNHRIQMCDEMGECQVYGSFGTGPGEFARPLG